MHDSPEGGFEHHRNARADGHSDHDPVQVGDKSQQITAKEQSILRNEDTPPKSTRTRGDGFGDYQ